MKKIIYIIGFLGSVALTGGVTFKLLHMPGAHELFIIGYLTLCLVFIPLWASDRLKGGISEVPAEKWKLILGVISSIILGAAGLFKIMYLQGADWLLILGVIVFAVGFLPLFFFTLYKRSVS